MKPPLFLLLALTGCVTEKVVERPCVECAARRAAMPRVATNDVQVTIVLASAGVSVGNPRLPLGEVLLQEYGKRFLPPENDLALMARLMENVRLILKTDAERFTANEDWAAAFVGQNSAKEQFLPHACHVLNQKGQLLDRWGTPLFFHSLGKGRFDLRTAGPDRKLFTADDIERKADGRVRRGAVQ